MIRTLTLTPPAYAGGGDYAGTNCGLSRWLTFAPASNRNDRHTVRLKRGSNIVAEFPCTRRGRIYIEDGFDSVLIVPNYGDVYSTYTWLIGAEETDVPPDIGVPDADLTEFLGSVAIEGAQFAAPVQLNVAADNAGHTVVMVAVTQAKFKGNYTAVIQNNGAQDILVYNGGILGSPTSTKILALAYVVKAGGDIKNIPCDPSVGFYCISTDTNANTQCTVSYTSP